MKDTDDMTTKSRASLRSAIDAKCKGCNYDPEAKGLGGWREQIAACLAMDCPLYAVRPVPRPKKSDGAP